MYSLDLCITEKKRNALNTLQRKPSMAQRQAPTPDSIRSSLISTISDQSNFSISSSTSSGSEWVNNLVS